MTATALDPNALLEKHRERLDSAVRASSTRGYYAAFDESPSPRVYGETAAADGKAAYDAWLGTDFPLDTPGSDGTVTTERSPFGIDLQRFGILRLVLPQAIKPGLHFTVRLGRAVTLVELADQIGPGALQQSQPVVFASPHLVDRTVLLNLCYRRQESRALQTIAIEAIGR
jgi:hypothetical protein